MNIRPQVLPSLASSVLLLTALGDHPYGYYTFLRWAVFLTCCLVAKVAWESRARPVTFLFAAVAILFNPVVPVYLARSTWLLLDLICAGLFGLAVFFPGKPTPPTVEDHKPSPPPERASAKSGEVELLQQLADRLSPLVPEWDVRVMDFNGVQAVVLDVYPNQIDSDGTSLSVGMVALYVVDDGQWWARTLLLDADGDPMQPAPPAEAIGIEAGDLSRAARRILSVLVEQYRSAAEYQPTGMPVDALALGYGPHARSALERLTDDRVSRMALFHEAPEAGLQPRSGAGAPALVQGAVPDSQSPDQRWVCPDCGEILMNAPDRAVHLPHRVGRP